MSARPYPTVLVGTDGSDSSFKAVDRAALIARDAGATLLLATAYRPMSSREVQEAQDALGGESYKVSGSTPAEDVLRDAADRARALGATEVDTLAVEGDPVDAIPALRGHLARTEAGGTQHLVGWGLGLLAEAHLRNDQPVEALHLLDDALARVARTGERSYESELHRLRALCLVALRPPHPELAHGALLRAAAVAREQGSALLLRRAIETCRTIGARRHSGSCDHPDAQL